MGFLIKKHIKNIQKNDVFYQKNQVFEGKTYKFDLKKTPIFSKK
jgi:hypothetical protein